MIIEHLEEQISILTTENKRLKLTVSNLELANKEARITIDRLNELIPREANNGGSEEAHFA